MKQGDSKSTGPRVSEAESAADTKAASTSSEKANPPREIGGRKGPDPTRFGDWEKNGRCIDF